MKKEARRRKITLVDSVQMLATNTICTITFEISTEREHLTVSQKKLSKLENLLDDTLENVFNAL
ncbi:MAG: hypothetical protein ACXAC8_05765 [Candidatus Hodarchaeales archaeon]|jgi:hypothetical protein